MLMLREIYPYLVAKREQAAVAYTMLEMMVVAKQLGHSPQRDSVRAKRQIMVNLMSDLNHARPVTMPDWRANRQPLEPGWYLRQDIIWAKPNPMPESVTDRCTKSHEYLFLLSKTRDTTTTRRRSGNLSPNFISSIGTDIDSQQGSFRDARENQRRLVS